MNTRTMAGKQLIAFTLYPGVTPLDLVGPLTVLRNLANGTRYRTVVVGSRIEPARTDTPLLMLPGMTYEEAPRPYAVFVPGGGAATVDAMTDEPLLAYLRSAAATAELIGATGNGALILAAAGLLGGRRTAVHWAYADLLEAMGTRVSQDRWVHDGRLLTSAGGSAGIDMMLYLLAKIKGRASAELAQLFLEYDPEPPFGVMDRSRIDGELTALLRGAAGSPRAMDQERR
ncbi:MAG TPA: DJ-1/PfpI family protein [Micromonosporaceae bacterium]